MLAGLIEAPRWSRVLGRVLQLQVSSLSWVGLCIMTGPVFQKAESCDSAST